MNKYLRELVEYRRQIGYSRKDARAILTLETKKRPRLNARASTKTKVNQDNPEDYPCQSLN